MTIAMMFLKLLGGLALFMAGMERTSDGIQKAAGERLQNTLNFMTKNSVMGVMSGALVTVAVQSSSATTVMLITFVNAGLLTLKQGIGVIMGANIGTTLTGWIIAGVGIAKFSIAAMAVPLFGAGFFMSGAKRRSESFRSYGQALMGLALIFLGLDFIGAAIPRPSPEVLLFLQRFSGMGFIAIALAVVAGAVFTILVHASSATMAVVIAMAAQGLIAFELAAALTLGANIGTTIDAFLASISAGASTNAKRAAWAHILFNVLGTIWVVVIFKPFINLVNYVVPGELSPSNMGMHIAMLHTLFNSLNTVVLLPFVSQYTNFLCRLIPEKPGESELRAIYLPKTLMDTPELSLLQARKEIGDMAALARSMFSRLRGDFEADPMDFATEIDWFTAKENYADTMYEELSKFLLAVSNSDLSDKTRMRVGIKLRIVSELENITDECLSLALLLKKKSSKGLVFESESFLGLKPLSDHVEEFLAFVADRLHRGITEIELSMASEMENEIDEDKRRLKKLARQRLKEGADVRAELLYIDFVRHMEKIGDYAYAIAGELRNFPSR